MELISSSKQMTLQGMPLYTLTYLWSLISVGKIWKEMGRKERFIQMVKDHTQKNPSDFQNASS